MPSIESPEEIKARAEAVGAMLTFIAEGIMEGVWKTFEFKVRQHRKERVGFSGLRSVEPTKVEITFRMDVDEESFKADIAKRQKEVSEALSMVQENTIQALIEHDGTEQ